MRWSVTSLLMLISSITSPAHGSGNSLTSESSARVLGSAGAGKEALSDDPIGLFYNPSVWSTSAGTEISVSGTYLTAGSAFDATTNFGGRSVGSNFLPDAFLGTIALRHSLSSNLALGFTIGPGFGLSVDYPANWTAAALVTRAELKQVAVSPSLSWRLGDTVSLGIAPILEIGELTYHSNTPFGAIQRTYDTSLALGVQFGTHVKLSDDTEIGATFRYSPDHSYRGTRSGLLPSQSSIRIDSPNILAVGLRQRAAADLTFLASASWFGWSNSQQQTIVEPTAGNTEILRNWGDGWQFSIGAEYDVSPEISARVGVSYSTNFISISNRVPDAPFDTQRRFGVGLTYHPTEDYSWDIAYGYNDLGDNTLQLTGASYGGLSATGQLKTTGHVFSLQYNTSLTDLLESR